MSDCEICRNHKECKIEEKDKVNTCWFVYPSELELAKKTKEYALGYEQGRADYEAECKQIFEDNPPMHFNREQIFWIKEYIKHSRAEAYEQGRADREKEICDFLKALIESDYSSKECKLLNSDLLEMIKEQKK